jgi:hypothetical protein
LVKIWPAREPQAIELSPPGGDEVGAIARCDAGRVAVAREKEVSIIDLATGAVQKVPVASPPIAIACAPGAGKLLLGTEKGAAMVDMRGAAPAIRPLPGHRQRLAAPDGREAREVDAAVPEVALSRDGRHGVSLGYDGSIRMWDVATGKQVQVLEVTDEEKVYATSVDFGHAGDTILVGDSSGQVVEWRVADGKEVRRARPHRNTIVALEVSPDGSRIATASSDRSVFLIRQRDLSVERTIEEHAALLSSVDWSPDGQLLVTGSEDPSAFIWEAASGALVGTVEPGGGGAFGAVFAGERLVAATRGGRVTSFAASRESRSPGAIRQILGCRLPFRLGGGGIERIAPGEVCR